MQTSVLELDISISYRNQDTVFKIGKSVFQLDISILNRYLY